MKDTCLATLGEGDAVAEGTTGDVGTCFPTFLEESLLACIGVDGCDSVEEDTLDLD